MSLLGSSVLHPVAAAWMIHQQCNSETANVELNMEDCLTSFCLCPTGRQHKLKKEMSEWKLVDFHNRMPQSKMESKHALPQEMMMNCTKSMPDFTKKKGCMHQSFMQKSCWNWMSLACEPSQQTGANQKLFACWQQHVTWVFQMFWLPSKLTMKRLSVQIALWKLCVKFVNDDVSGSGLTANQLRRLLWVVADEKTIFVHNVFPLIMSLSMRQHFELCDSKGSNSPQTCLGFGHLQFQIPNFLSCAVTSSVW